MTKEQEHKLKSAVGKNRGMFGNIPSIGDLDKVFGKPVGDACLKAILKNEHIFIV